MRSYDNQLIDLLALADGVWHLPRNLPHDSQTQTIRGSFG
jgi:hypothetical protein